MKELQSITLKESVLLSSPHSYGLLVTKLETSVNVMGISWFSFISMNPGMMAFSISNKSYTKELIDKGAGIALCLPGEGILTKAFECGKCSGRNTDKVKCLNIDIIDIEEYSAAVVSDSSVAWILKTIYSLDAGDHTLYTSEIKKVVGNVEEKHAYAFDGYKRIGILKLC